MTSEPNDPPQGTTDETYAIADQAAFWFARLRAEDLGDLEKARFRQWIAQHPAHRRAFDEISDLWDDPDFEAVLAENPRPSRDSRGPAVRYRKIRPQLALAAVVALVAIFAREPLIWLQSDYHTASGERRVVHLVDGSAITLNTDTAISVDLDGGQRRIRLYQGEAFFDVKRDENRPFVVDSGAALVRVLGTRFIVREQDRKNRVTVISGRVAVAPASGNSRVDLAPGQQVVVQSGQLEAPRRISPDRETDWLRGYLVFQNTPLAQVAAELDRYLPGLVVLADSSLRDYKINARLDITRPEATLDAMQQTLPLKITRLGSWLVLIRRA